MCSFVFHALIIVNMEKSKIDNEDCNDEGAFDNEVIVKTLTMNVVTPTKKYEGSFIVDNNKGVESISAAEDTEKVLEEKGNTEKLRGEKASTSIDDDATDKNESEVIGSMMEEGGNLKENDSIDWSIVDYKAIDKGCAIHNKVVLPGKRKLDESIGNISARVAHQYVTTTAVNGRVVRLQSKVPTLPSIELKMRSNEVKRVRLEEKIAVDDEGKNNHINDNSSVPCSPRMVDTSFGYVSPGQAESYATASNEMRNKSEVLPPVQLRSLYMPLEMKPNAYLQSEDFTGDQMFAAGQWKGFTFSDVYNKDKDYARRYIAILMRDSHLPRLEVDQFFNYILSREKNIDILRYREFLNRRKQSLQNSATNEESGRAAAERCQRTTDVIADAKKTENVEDEDSEFTNLGSFLEDKEIRVHCEFMKTLYSDPESVQVPFWFEMLERLNNLMYLKQFYVNEKKVCTVKEKMKNCYHNIFRSIELNDRVLYQLFWKEMMYYVHKHYPQWNSNSGHFQSNANSTERKSLSSGFNGR